MLIQSIQFAFDNVRWSLTNIYRICQFLTLLRHILRFKRVFLSSFIISTIGSNFSPLLPNIAQCVSINLFEHIFCNFWFFPVLCYSKNILQVLELRKFDYFGNFTISFVRYPRKTTITSVLENWGCFYITLLNI